MSIKRGRAAKVGLHEVSGKEQISRALEERGSPASSFSYGWQTWKVGWSYGLVMIFKAIELQINVYFFHPSNSHGWNGHKYFFL